MSAPSDNLVLEFTIEPFVPANPGPHVIEAQRAANLAVGVAHNIDIGPFGAAVTGSPEEITAALTGIVNEAFTHGAKRVSLQVSLPD